ncbi:hypothetical protein V8C26DRAFT_390803 [Trichoderma gracile]
MPWAPFRVRADSAALLRRHLMCPSSCHTSKSSTTNIPPPSVRESVLTDTQESPASRGKHPRNHSTDLATISSSCLCCHPNLPFSPPFPLILMPPPAHISLGPSGNRVSTVSCPYSLFSRFDLLLFCHTRPKQNEELEGVKSDDPV